MTPDSQPQSQQTHGSQSETKKTEGQLSWWGKFKRSRLKRQTRQELEEQIKDVIISQNIKNLAKERMTNQIDKKVKEIKEDLEKHIILDLKKDYKKVHNDILKLNIAIIVVTTLIAILSITGRFIINDILSIDMLKSNIETLKGDVEDIEDQIRN